MTSEAALRELMAGNARFVNNKRIHPNSTVVRLAEVAHGQDPFAILLCCSDSRTPPEIVFDHGIGDLFIIRTAGNVAGDVAIGSMELAVEEFGVPLIMVMGHQRCGAIKMALEGLEIPGHVVSIMDHLQAAVEMSRGLSGDSWDNASQANVKYIVNHLKDSKPILKRRVLEGKLRIIGAYKWLDTGVVDVIVP
ncbi:MAG: carbonic anhydrase [bacterium]